MEPGRVLADRYEILGPIAEGAGSTVWEARDRETGETVAVKAVSLEQAGWRAEVRDRFQQEARLLTLVRHRHVVGVRDLGETDDGYLYLILDRLSGETLADRLARPPRLSWREAAAVALELARGLGALHARGVVHRDLKPANVILHDEGGRLDGGSLPRAPGLDGGSRPQTRGLDGGSRPQTRGLDGGSRPQTRGLDGGSRPQTRGLDGGSRPQTRGLDGGSRPQTPGRPVSKIIDLGISKVGAAAADPVLFATLTATGQVLGTPEYMSREQALGERDVDARTDVWALGVVLYEMLAGRRPFAGPNVNAVLAAIRRGPPPPLSAVARGTPEALARVVDRCLDASRDRRFRDGEALGDALALAARRGEEAEARATRRRRLAIAGGAALLAAGVGLATLTRRAPAPAPAGAQAAPTSVWDEAAAARPDNLAAAPASAAAPSRATSAPAPSSVPSAAPPARGGRSVTHVNSAGF